MADRISAAGRFGSMAPSVEDHLFGLPPEKRLISFRALAREARERSESAQQQYLKDGYAQVSRSWERMALEIEADI